MLAVLLVNTLPVAVKDTLPPTDMNSPADFCTAFT